jgi:Flp pilus assembly protein TadG
VTRGCISEHGGSLARRGLGGLLRSWAPAAGNEEGSSLVEFALSAAILLALVLGIMGFSLVAYSYLYVSDAARQGTRYAMVRGNSQTSDCTAPGPANCIAQTADIQTYVQNGALPGLKGSNLTVTSTWLTSAGASCGTTDSCKSPGNQVRVTVSYSYPLSLGYLPHQTFSMSSRSQVFIAR